MTSPNTVEPPDLFMHLQPHMKKAILNKNEKKKKHCVERTHIHKLITNGERMTEKDIM